MSNRSRSAPTWPRSLPGEAKARWVMPRRAARSTNWTACERTCCSVAGGKCGGSASGWLTLTVYRYRPSSSRRRGGQLCPEGHLTAKWTAITDRLAGTLWHTDALSSQVSAADALAGGSLNLHGMQEVRGSSPLNSAFSQVNGLL